MQNYRISTDSFEAQGKNKKGKFESSDDFQVKAIELGKQFYQLGVEDLHSYKYESAWKYFNDAATVDYPFAYLRLVYLFHHRDEFHLSCHENQCIDYHSKILDYDDDGWFEAQEKTKDPEMQFLLGWHYYEKTKGEFSQDFKKGIKHFAKKAIKFFEKAAKQGHVDALCALGDCYRMGTGGFKQDLKKAIKYYTQAAEKGYAHARTLFKLGFCFSGGVAIQYFEQAFTQGYWPVKEEIIECYKTGKRGVIQNLVKVQQYEDKIQDSHIGQLPNSSQHAKFEQYQQLLKERDDLLNKSKNTNKASASGIDAEYSSVFGNYLAGTDTRNAIVSAPSNNASNLSNFTSNRTDINIYPRISGLSNQPQSQIQQPQMRQPQNVVLRIQLTRRTESGFEDRLPTTANVQPMNNASELGEKKYKEGLAHLHLGQYKSALECFNAAIAENYPPAYFRKAHLACIQDEMKCKGFYAGDSRTLKDAAKSHFEWLKSPQRNNDPEIQFLLGWCYTFEIGTTKDLKTAVLYFEKAAEQRHADAQYYLGKHYYSYIEASFQNRHDATYQEARQKAIKYYEPAARQNHIFALYNLAQLQLSANTENTISNLEEAISNLEKASKLGYWPASYQLGVFFEKRGDKETARRYYSQSMVQGNENVPLWLVEEKKPVIENSSAIRSQQSEPHSLQNPKQTLPSSRFDSQPVFFASQQKPESVTNRSVSSPSSPSSASLSASSQFPFNNHPVFSAPQQKAASLTSQPVSPVSHYSARQSTPSSQFLFNNHPVHSAPQQKHVPSDPVLCDHEYSPWPFASPSQ